ncbi:Fic family protein [Chitinophaga jiangningensis]|uniref:Fic family protein n=1 Tax=Chitinophaga jiangningensis TaxID=1419482 RepID=A0A1M6YRP5_9BACT|nr:Fic family protein [Chitinophaga jiangningensis]SHL20991.1 Fic family protein [Chitinophaga jiangningensis]
MISEKATLLKAIAEFPDGASLDEIIATSGFSFGRRTFQRRLEELKKSGEIIITGATRNLRYHIAAPDFSATKLPSSAITLSEAAQELLKLVQRPVQQRQPVGYNRSFLEKYQPNISNYLSTAELKKLAELGGTARLNEPAGTYAKEILNRLLIDLSWNSSRLEGNTYSLLDTERLISSGHVADNKSAKEAQMILNHKDAIEFIVQLADEIGFNRYTLLNLHSLLSNNLLPNPAASGRLRHIAVGIQNSVYTPLAVPQLIEEMFDLMLDKASQIENPFEQAFFIMVHIPYLQPFDDVNKRVSRLASNISLNKHNLAPLSFIDVPNELYTKGLIGVYELNNVELLKDVFLWAYERSAAQYAVLRQSLGEPDPFRFKYRDQIRSIIHKIISEAMAKSQVEPYINDQAQELPEVDRNKLIEVVESELLTLHEGNFARYLVRPSEFKKWQEKWKY